MRSLLHRCLALAIVPAVLTVAARASATPTVVINTSGILRFATDEKTQIASLIVHGNQQGINLKECTDDTWVRFPLTTTGLPTSDSLQVWAGTSDCTQQGATTTQTATCWPIKGAITPQLGFYVDIRVQDIVSQLYATTKTLTYSPATSQTCTDAAASTTTTTTTDDAGNPISSGETTVNIFFMWFAGGASTPEASAPAYPIKVKLVGPAAPTNVAAGIGDGLLIVSWNAPAGEADLQGYHLFSAAAGSGGDGGSSGEGGVTTICNDAAQGTQLIDDAGNPVFDDAGNPVFVDDAGNPISQDAGCYQVYTPPPGTNQCSGTPTLDTTTATMTTVAGNTNAKATIPSLTNGTSYAVAVSAYDSFENDGKLSSVVCATPEPIDDFWKKYREEGGTAGGCALEAVGSGTGPGATVIVLAAGVILARRRRRSKST